MNIYRTHTCGELTEENEGQEVRISGWVETIRDLGAITFIDVKDQFGITQVMISKNEKVEKEIKGLTVQSTIKVVGKVALRDDEVKNLKIATGKIEIIPTKIEVLGTCKSILPFEIGEEAKVREDLRLEYRFLDLRNSKIHNNILLRSKVLKFMRDKMDEENFTEIQTPILTSSSPEGARDFLVPSRLNPGSFYALPQAPQQFKQLLMIGGFDRYYQIAPCFRDEDPRADRSPGEFYQLDIEMAFATQDDVFGAVEKLLPDLFKTFTKNEVTEAPFVRIKYEDAMLKYGIDKPDLRNPLVIKDLSKIFENSDFNAFKGKTIRVIVAPNTVDKTRKFFDNMTEFAVKECEAKGLAWIKVNEDNTFTGPIAKFINEEDTKKVINESEAKAGDSIFFIAGEKKQAEKISGLIRIELGKQLELIQKNVYKFCWIVDFPIYEINDDEKIDFSHNPFSMPQGGMQDILTKDPLDIYGYQYDLVCNGYELASGAVRNHSPELMVKMFEIAGYTKETVENKFPALFNAFKFGAPPHAGTALGIDRIMMLIKEEVNIREVIAFPKNSRAQDLLMGAPSSVTEDQLKEIHIKLDLPKNK